MKQTRIQKELIWNKSPRIMGDGRQIHWPAGHVPPQPGLGPLYTGPRGPRVVLRPHRETAAFPFPMAVISGSGSKVGKELSSCAQLLKKDVSAN